MENAPLFPVNARRIGKRKVKSCKAWFCDDGFKVMNVYDVCPSGSGCLQFVVNTCLNDGLYCRIVILTLE